MVEYNKGVKKEIRKEFEQQLHEQYAINNNAHLSNVIMLLVALIAVFSGFGYIFLNSSIRFSSDFDFVESGRFSLDAFLFTAIATNVVLYIMARICIYQGFSGRYEQFITYALRRKNKMFQPPYTFQNTNNNKIFPKGYMPFGKKGLDIPQGLFAEFIKIFRGLAFLIQCSVLIKLSFNICKFDHGVSVIGIVSVIIYLLSFHLLLVSIDRYWSEKESKYHELEKYYLTIFNDKALDKIVDYNDNFKYKCVYYRIWVKIVHKLHHLKGWLY